MPKKLRDILESVWSDNKKQNIHFTRRINGHNVSVTFDKRDPTHDGKNDSHYTLSYSVNGRWNKKDAEKNYSWNPDQYKEIDQDTGKEIKKYVSKAVHTFVRHKKPKILDGEAVDRFANKRAKRIFKGIADKFKGKHEYSWMPWNRKHSVKFRE